MKEGIKLLAELVNNLHDVLIMIINDIFGWGLTDKDMHFWVMGFIGISVFLGIYLLSKWISKLPFGITLLAFFYTLTFMLVLVFAIEIQQAITNRGNMEFFDAVIGLWGFIAFFLVYIGIILLFLLGKKLFSKYRNTKSRNMDV
ncbi:hypothetical protein [Bacillus seohaeanensis]|uniref:Permease n=1 Tax=Bacillus seohaeanensis TaxID=284580 RepID=A0ABW5RQD9_9BACI